MMTFIVELAVDSTKHMRTTTQQRSFKQVASELGSGVQTTS